MTAMLTGMRHRGPDGAGVISGDGVVIGSTRLAISGPDSLPTPLADANRRRALAYNGELYGLQLRRDQSDTSWLHRELSRSGLGTLASSDGMYALGIADLEEARVTLARDPWGIKPLYVRHDRSGLSFASEVGPLWGTRPTPPTVNQDALLEYVGLGCRIGEDTVFPDIVNLEPGTCLMAEASGSSVRCNRYRIAAVTDDGKEEADVALALRKSVIACAETTRRLGLFLSGGLDSVAIATLLAEEGIEDVHCFSLLLGSDGVRDLRDLGLPGKSWRTWKHHALQPSERDLDAAFDTVLDSTSEPCFPASAAYTFLLSEMAAREGVRVVLSGEGADELFGGYESYLRFLYGGAGDEADAFYLGTPVFRWARRLAYGDAPGTEETVRRRLQPLFGKDGDPFLRVLRAERRLSLRPLLDRLDHTSMRHSIEVRVPFLHGAVPTSALASSSRYFEPPGATKPALRRALYSLMGEAAWRLPKTPLRVPLRLWLKGGGLLRILASLGSPSFRHHLPCDGEALGQLISALRGTHGPGELLVAVRLHQLFRYCERFAA